MSAPPLIFVVGPTASGKSALALELAETLPAEIISMDSAQVYRGLDIGTAKPDAALQRRIPHHLLDIRDPAERYSAAQFAADAAALAADIHHRGRLPLIVGGTFLYMRALLEGLHPLPPADPALRAELDAEAGAAGWPALHARLAGLDAAAAARIHPNDAQRIQRALEVALSGERTRSETFAAAVRPAWPGPVLRLATLPEDRAALRRRIAERFDAMLSRGLLEEVRALHRRGDLHGELPAIRSVGYRQLWQYLDGECDYASAVSRAVTATRQYAKRQLTWLRREAGLLALPDEPGSRRRAADVAIGRFLDTHAA